MTNLRPGDVCPDLEMLSAYLDGKLDATLRGPIEDHISRCEDCYFVVRETAATWAETGAEGSSLGGADAPGRGASVDGESGVVAPRVDAAAVGGGPQQVVPRNSPGRSLFTRYLLPIAATLIVGVGAVALWREARRVETYSDAVRPLVRAVGERRFFEPRLTGGFEFGPPISAKRSPGSAADSTTWEVLAVAGELRGRPGATSPAARGARGAAALFLGDVNAAVAIYSQLLHDDPRSAEWHSNLAAALLVRGASEVGSPDQRGKDAEEALRHADEALRMDPALNEARFNRGLALTTLGRAEEARHSFAELERQGGSWSLAARDHLRDLEEVSGRRP